MYVATSTDRRLAEAALRCAGIDGYFRGLITCADVGASKEDSPAVYESAMRRLQSNKRDTVIFEDSLTRHPHRQGGGLPGGGGLQPGSRGRSGGHPGRGGLLPPLLRGDVRRHRPGLTRRRSAEGDPDEGPFFL